jgi:hypothetical protein
MKCFVILCHRPNNLISKGIREVTGSYWNHGAILVNGYVYEAVYPRIKKTPYTEWLELHNYELKLIDYELINDPNELVGLRYDLGIFVNELCFYVASRIFGKYSKTAKFFSNRNDEKKYFCFEMTAWCVGKKNSWKANGLTFDNRTN